LLGLFSVRRMRVTKWGECGILCALHLAKNYGELAIGAAEIAESQGIDLPYTQQILQRLRKGDVIESVRGPKGGYKLLRPPAQITLKDILYAVEGDTFQIICEHAPLHPETEGPTRCSTRESCGLHGVWQDLRSAIDKLLEERTLQDLIQTDVRQSLVQLNTPQRP
jgi:Rrf2 family iron-sulfur cluster assembly transcriptional regulator